MAEHEGWNPDSILLALAAGFLEESGLEAEGFLSSFSSSVSDDFFLGKYCFSMGKKAFSMGKKLKIVINPFYFSLHQLLQQFQMHL